MDKCYLGDKVFSKLTGTKYEIVGISGDVYRCIENPDDAELDLTDSENIKDCVEITSEDLYKFYGYIAHDYHFEYPTPENCKIESDGSSTKITFTLTAGDSVEERSVCTGKVLPLEVITTMPNVIAFSGKMEDSKETAIFKYSVKEDNIRKFITFDSEVHCKSFKLNDAIGGEYILFATFDTEDVDVDDYIDCYEDHPELKPVMKNDKIVGFTRDAAIYSIYDKSNLANVYGPVRLPVDDAEAVILDDFVNSITVLTPWAFMTAMLYRANNDATIITLLSEDSDLDWTGDSSHDWERINVKSGSINDVKLALSVRNEILAISDCELKYSSSFVDNIHTLDEKLSSSDAKMLASAVNDYPIILSSHVDERGHGEHCFVLTDGVKIVTITGKSTKDCRGTFWSVATDEEICEK